MEETSKLETGNLELMDDLLRSSESESRESLTLPVVVDTTRIPSASVGSQTVSGTGRAPLASKDSRKSVSEQQAKLHSQKIQSWEDVRMHYRFLLGPTHYSRSCLVSTSNGTLNQYLSSENRYSILRNQCRISMISGTYCQGWFMYIERFLLFCGNVIWVTHKDNLLWRGFCCLESCIL